MGNKKKKRAGKIPPENQPQAGPGRQADAGETPAPADGAPFQEQDPQRRLGNYGTAGEHPRQQPGGRHEADH